MNDVAAATAKKIEKKVDRKIAQNIAQAGEISTDRTTELDRRYGQIGISAVAAAARYLGAAKNTAYAPAPVRWTGPADEAA